MVYLFPPFRLIRETTLSTLSNSFPSLDQCNDGFGSAVASI
jgi:hypothetical protein